LTTKQIKHSRILHLHKLAKSKKYTWEDLKYIAIRMGVTEPTANKYLGEVKERLVKEGLIQA